ncbi:hypothetical protein ANCDUO_19861, partial [Ancylostoma duodenale]
KGGLFVVTPEQFAKQAVNTIGLTSKTSGCFNHEIQLNKNIIWLYCGRDFSPETDTDTNESFIKNRQTTKHHKQGVEPHIQCLHYPYHTALHRY